MAATPSVDADGDGALRCSRGRRGRRTWPGPSRAASLAAASKSPSVSSRAFLASIIPAPVAWRRAWTSLAVIDMAGLLLGACVRGDRRSAGAVGLGGGPRRPGPRRRARLGGGPRLGGGLGARRGRRPRRRARPRRRRLGAAAAGGGGAWPAARRASRSCWASERLAAGLGLLGGDRRLLVLGALRRGGRRGAVPRREAMKRPSSTASAMTRHMRVPERMASSLPGMTYWMTSGSQLVSTTATIGMPSLLASVTAMCSFFVSRMNTASGSRSMLGDAAEVALELLELAAEEERFLLGHGLELAGVAHALVLLHLRRRACRWSRSW